MMNKLRKIAPYLLFAAIALAVIVPLSAVIAPHVAWAQTTAPTSAPASAEESWLGNMVVKGIAAIVQVLIDLFGKLAIQLIHILILVAGYNSYMTAPAVTAGWVILRDVANLFFVALILVVSIGSIVNPDRFGGARQVFRILLYALLVNFSRTIAGLFIDISQLIMLTFVNGFAQAAGGNFVEALGISKLTDFPQNGGAIGVGMTLAAIFMALIMFVIIVVVVGVMTVALVVRMVTLWMLVVMSPIAFALGSSDLTKKYYAEWWSKFSKELTVGPIVAFFLWLSLMTFQSSSGSSITGQSLQAKGTGAEAVGVSCGAAIACAEENMIRFIVAICMLLMGLGFAKEFSGAGGTLAGAASSKLKGYAKGALNYSTKKSAGAAKAAVGATGIPLAVNKVGDVYTSLKRKAATGIGNTLGTTPGVGRLARSISGSMLTSTSARDEKQLEEAKKRMKNYTPEMAAAVLRGKLSSTDAERKAVALSMTKDKGYSRARLDDEKDENKKKAAAFVAATRELDRAAKAGDKDSKEQLDKIKDARPDTAAIISLEPKPDGSYDDAAAIKKIEDAGYESDEDKLKKVDFDLMSVEHRNAYFRGMDRKGDGLNRFYEKGSSAKERGYIDEYRRSGPPSGPLLKGKDLRDAIQSGTINVELAPGKIKQDDGTMAPNVDLAVETVNVGSGAQVRMLQDKKDASLIRDAITDALRKNVDFDSGAGLSGDRMSDENLRHAETAVILGANAADLYKIKSDGAFASEKAKKSLVESVKSSPQRYDMVLNMPTSALKGEAGAVVDESLDVSDINMMARRAKNDDERRVVAAVVRNAMNRATEKYTSATTSAADKAQAKKRMQEIAANANLNVHIPTDELPDFA